jgi:hypothetical protein
MHIFKGFEDQSDTYHDTRTHYLMEQDPFLLQDQAKVMDAAAADKVEALKNEKMGPPGPCSSRSGSRYSMSRTCGPRDIISLVIPKLGDNNVLLSNNLNYMCFHVITWLIAFYKQFAYILVEIWVPWKVVPLCL